MDENYPCLISLKELKPEFATFQKIPINSEEFTIGRSLENSIVIPYIAISRKHCTLRKTNNCYWTIEDFSSFGIELNNKKLKKNCISKLCDNDIIQFDATGEFVYKFFVPDDKGCIPRKKRKLEENCELTADILQNVALKFEESQNFEMKHIEDKIQNAKQMQTTSLILKQQLESDMARKIQQLESEFALQIENLKGEKNEVERQKVVLEEERDVLLLSVKKDMEERICDLMNQIQKHNEAETELLKENSSLKERLLKEREDFLAELHKENSSKKDLLTQLELKMKEQDEKRLREKQELEDMLRAETEQLRLAKEKELQELEKQNKIRQEELENELNKIKLEMKENLDKNELEKARIAQELNDKMDEMVKVSKEEKSKLEQLLQEKENAERLLAEAQTNTETQLEELRKQVSVRETELAALTSQRIQQQTDQSVEVINCLQQELDNAKSQLKSLEIEKNHLQECQTSTTNDCDPSSSKQVTLTEVGELMESELQCSICAELFIAPTMLNCAHTFCKYCITIWKKKKKECPICRKPIITECKSLVLDSFIEKMVANLTDDMKKRRETMLKDREELDAELAQRNSAGTRSGGSDSAGDEDYNSEYIGEEEEEPYNYEIHGFRGFEPVVGPNLEVEALRRHIEYIRVRNGFIEPNADHTFSGSDEEPTDVTETSFGDAGAENTWPVAADALQRHTRRIILIDRPRRTTSFRTRRRSNRVIPGSHNDNT